MNSLFSILALLFLTAWLSNLDRIPWPLQRTEPIYDTYYWQSVLESSLDYLKTHTNLS